jgi:hypothetical protein
MANANRHAGEEPVAQAEWLGISVDDWWRIREEMDDWYEERHMLDQMEMEDYDPGDGELSEPEARELEALAGDAAADALDIDVSYAYRMVDYIEDHSLNARFDGTHVIGIAPATDREGRRIQDVQKFDASVSNKTLRRNVRNWLGY